MTPASFISSDSLHDCHDAAQAFTASSYVFVKFQLDSHEKKQTQHLQNLVPQLYKVKIPNAHRYFMQLLSDYSNLASI